MVTCTIGRCEECRDTVNGEMTRREVAGQLGIDCGKVSCLFPCPMGAPFDFDVSEARFAPHGSVDRQVPAVVSADVLQVRRQTCRSNHCGQFDAQKGECAIRRKTCVNPDCWAIFTATPASICPADPPRWGPVQVKTPVS